MGALKLDFAVPKREGGRTARARRRAARAAMAAAGIRRRVLAIPAPGITVRTARIMAARGVVGLI